MTIWPMYPDTNIDFMLQVTKNTKEVANSQGIILQFVYRSLVETLALTTTLSPSSQPDFYHFPTNKRKVATSRL